MAKKKVKEQIKETIKKVVNRSDLERQLGKLAYRIGKQAELVNRENNKLIVLQQQANVIATEIEKLDG